LRRFDVDFVEGVEDPGGLKPRWKQMASIRKEIMIGARPEKVWAAVRDLGAVHWRLARGFVTDVRLEADA
jgi:hypothetical protein